MTEVSLALSKVCFAFFRAVVELICLVLVDPAAEELTDKQQTQTVSQIKHLLWFT